MAFLSIYFAGGGAACRAFWNERPYFDIYDEAINLYWKEPRDQQAAIDLLKNACRWNSDLQDATCFNLGTLLELEGRADEALDAYRRAEALRSAPVYQAAIQALAPHKPESDSEYLRAMGQAVAFCHQGNRGAALAALEQARAAAERSGEPAPATAFQQPFFSDCLRGLPDFEVFLKRSPPAPPSLREEQLRLRARAHGFAALWDMEFHLRRGQGESRNPLTESWRRALAYADSGSGAAFAAELKEFNTRLESACAPQAALRRRCLAIRRAAVALVLHDPAFARIRDHAAVEAAIATLPTR